MASLGNNEPFILKPKNFFIYDNTCQVGFQILWNNSIWKPLLLIAFSLESTALPYHYETWQETFLDIFITCRIWLVHWNLIKVIEIAHQIRWNYYNDIFIRQMFQNRKETLVQISGERGLGLTFAIYLYTNRVKTHLDRQVIYTHTCLLNQMYSHQPSFRQPLALYDMSTYVIVTAFECSMRTNQYSLNDLFKCKICSC